jgi:putative hydrolase of the HAD superfamily
MPPKILYFDLGMVLVEFSHERMCVQMADVAGTTPEAVREAIFGNVECSAALVEYETGRMTTDEFFACFSRVTGTSADRDWLADAVRNIFSPIEPMWDLVRRLHVAGNKLAILSNTNSLQWEYITAGRFPILAAGTPECAFDWAILSYEVGSMKPDRAIFDAAIDRAGVAAQEVFFTDDRLENVEGAQAVGIDAVQFVGAGQLIAELSKRGVAGVQSGLRRDKPAE